MERSTTMRRLLNPQPPTGSLPSRIRLRTGAGVAGIVLALAASIPLAASIEPEVVIDLLNTYLSKQARLVIKHDGIVDKYVGDELVAIFEGTDMVDNAILCAIEIQHEIHELNKSNPKKIDVRIGINTGMAIVGNVGSEERMDHTVLGRNMNLGARLCSIAQPGQIIISESSWRLLKSASVKVRELEPISVKGISRPVQIYEVLAGEETLQASTTRSS